MAGLIKGDVSSCADDSQHVDVIRAQEQFNELSRQLSKRSEAARNRTKSTESNAIGQDIEKGPASADDHFDLREYLTSSNDANQNAGIKHKNVGVVWNDLYVKVAGGMDSKIYVGTLGGAIMSFCAAPILLIWSLVSLLFPVKKSSTKTIIHPCSGVLKPREMCLVLGCPRSGCSTFLKTIANQREGYARVSGEVLYAGIEAEEMRKFYKGEVVYNQEDDIHIATLTVAQTLAFALSTKTPGPNGRLPGVTRKQFDAEVTDTLLRGETVYFGDIGEDSSIVREYFSRNGAICPLNVNPAEYILEAIGAGVTPRVGNQDWKDIWLESPESKQVKEEIAAIKQEALSLPDPGRVELSSYATSFFYQLKTVIGNSVREMQFRIFAIFWVVVLPAIVMSQIEPLFIRIFIRESSSRMYSPYVFAIGQVIGEIPYSILCGILYWVLMAYPMGFGQGSAGINGTGFQLLIIIFMLLFGVTLGQMIAAVSPSVQVAVLFNPFFGMVLGTFCGVTIPYPTMAKFWKSWLYQLDPFTRTLAAMVSTELHGLVIKCQPDEFAMFDPPSGQTCASWGQPFVDAFGGYIDNLSDSMACRYCQYAVGDQYYQPLNISFSNRWRDAFVLFAYFGAFCSFSFGSIPIDK
ncbi:hypothetical protein CVT25_002933 [Psilocybe cyanescens]|uniref:ABC-2 type transporter domain-containing protein n=1 Tax=Psilocybe cyanescens TaxID=93625 RepID=A0A409WMZ4_PSICY|nr:hypothetical protein CVT25_002933 [Psilocybe cyanescens]